MKNMLSKKIVAGLLAGAFVVTGAIGTYTYAAESQDTGNRHRIERREPQGNHPQMSNEQMAEKMASEFGLNKSEILNALNEKKDFRDVGHAAMLAKASGKSFANVLAMKTDSKHWKDVEESLGMTREKIKAVQDEMMAAHLESTAGITKTQAASLLSDGYHPHDIAAAGVLAKASGKDIKAVLAMKKINNDWRDVAKSLGVEEKTLRESMRPMGGPGFGGHRGGPGMGGPGPCMDGEPPQPPSEEQ